MTNRERLSETTSSVRVGRCAMSMTNHPSPRRPLSDGAEPLAYPTPAGLATRRTGACTSDGVRPSNRPDEGGAWFDGTNQTQPRSGFHALYRTKSDGSDEVRRLGRVRVLLRVELDDQLLGDVDDDLLTGRELVDQDAHPVGHDAHPGRHVALAVGLPGDDERRHVERLLADVDHVVGAHPVGGDVDLLAVHQEVAVHDDLAGLPTGPGEARAVDHVVEAGTRGLQGGGHGLGP